ncbi:RNA helicase [Ranunculus cassubicifolius]
MPERDDEGFAAMNLKEGLLKGIYSYGYKRPSIIQQKIIVPLCKGLDVIIQTITDPGKTVAYCLGMLQQLDHTSHKCQGLILAPSSIAVQNIAADLHAVGQVLGVNVYAFGQREDSFPVGGVHVVVGTPDLVVKLLKENKISCNHMKMLVLDEADLLLRYKRMHDEVYEIMNYLRGHTINKVQLCVFSETMPPTIVDSMSKMMKNPLQILAKNSNDELTLQGISKHQFVNVGDMNLKFKALCDLIFDKMSDQVKPVVVLLHNPHMLASFTEEMKNNGYTFAATRWNMDQNMRNEIAKEFLETGVLITTSRWARGIEFLQQVQSVVITEMYYGNEYLRLLGWFRRVTAAIIFTTQDDWISLIGLQEKYNVVFEKLGPSKFKDSFSTQVSRRRCRAREIENVKHVLYNHETEAGKLSTIAACLDEVFLAASMIVIFVNDSHKIDGLVDFLHKQDYIVFSTNEGFREHIAHNIVIRRPCVLVTTDMDVDLNIEVPLVVNYDFCLTSQQYDYRVNCCANNGVVVYLATKEDWVITFDIQKTYGVVLTLLPSDILEHLSRVSSTSKREKIVV